MNDMTCKQTFDLRPWRLSDLDDLVRYADNPNIARNLTDAFPSPYTRADGEAYLNIFCNQSPAKVFAIEIDGKAAGSIGVFPQTDIHSPNAEMGYWLAEPFWGKGIMPEAVRRIVEYAFGTFEINRIFARPFGRNKASQRVLEKAGFQFESRLEKVLIKNGKLEDEITYSIRRLPSPEKTSSI